jgi:hypothetical protein
MHVNLHAYIRTRAFTHTHPYAHAHIHRWIENPADHYTQTHARKPTQTHAHTHKHTHKHTHTHTHTHTHGGAPLRPTSETRPQSSQTPRFYIGGIIKAKDPYKRLKLIDVTGWTHAAMRRALVRKDCDAFFMHSTARDIRFRDAMFMGDENDPGRCMMANAGEPPQLVASGFAFSTMGETCPNFILGAFSEMLQVLGEEGVIQERIKRDMDMADTARCGAGEATTTSSVALSVINLAGVLLLHAVVVVFCLLGWLYPLHMRLRKRTAKRAAKQLSDAPIPVLPPPLEDTSDKQVDEAMSATPSSPVDGPLALRRYSTSHQLPSRENSESLDQLGGALRLHIDESARSQSARIDEIARSQSARSPSLRAPASMRAPSLRAPA